jgi:hypothetical protein
VRKIEECFQHVAECRGMARTASSIAHRQQLEQIAEAWERLAVLREQLNLGADLAVPKSHTCH